MKINRVQQTIAIGLFAAFWLSIFGLILLLNVNTSRAALIWAISAILGTAGILAGELMPNADRWPRAIVAFSLFLYTPGAFFICVPIPLPLAIITNIGMIEGFWRMPIRASFGCLIILTVGGWISWRLAALWIGLARKMSTNARGSTAWLVPFPVYLLGLLVIQLSGFPVLALTCLVGLYPSDVFFW